jgi:beta-phosphoglucomutase-like phosphatase (HAD superfamily)
MTRVGNDTVQTTTLLCDADGNLFPSEEPAFVASAEVTNAFLAAHCVSVTFEPEELRLATTGRNFRTTLADLAASHHVRLSAAETEHWVAEEQMAVTQHLAMTLRPAPSVYEPLRRLSAYLLLAAVSSSAAARLAACFDATDLSSLIPAARRFSAEDSLPRPTSKPDPAVYRHACQQLGVLPLQALAVEDSVPGAQSAVAAGIPAVGNLQFVPPAEQRERAQQLFRVGVCTIVGSWSELETLIATGGLLAASGATARRTNRKHGCDERVTRWC